MDILGISRAGFGSNYIPREIKTVSPETVRRQDEEQALQNSNVPKPESAVISQIEPVSEEKQQQASRIANLQDISLTFNTEEDYSYLGSDSSLEILDVQKAISDMQKDSILQEYQYFVGNAGSLMGADGSVLSSEDGIVIRKF